MPVRERKIDSVSFLTTRFLRIADVTMAVSFAPSLKLRKQDPAYSGFYASVSSENAPSIRMRLLNGRMPDLSRLDQLFDTRESWSLNADPRGYWIRFKSAEQSIPFWIARFDRQVGRVFVYCGSPLFQVRGEKTELANPVSYPLDQLLLMYYFARRRGLLLHGAGMVVNNRAYVFAGVSGAGKSTFSELLVKARAGKVLSDERMIVRAIASEMVAFGTPWSGTAGIARDGSASLAGIFFLKHGSANAIRPLMPVEALDRLLPAVSIPWYDPDTAAPIIAFAKQLTTAIPCHEFSFTPDSEAIDCFQEFLKQESLQRKKLKGKRKK